MGTVVNLADWRKAKSKPPVKPSGKTYIRNQWEFKPKLNNQPNSIPFPIHEKISELVRASERVWNAIPKATNLIDREALALETSRLFQEAEALAKSVGWKITQQDTGEYMLFPILENE